MTAYSFGVFFGLLVGFCLLNYGTRILFFEKTINTFFIFWAELWIRQNEFHWSLNSNYDGYAQSFLSVKRAERHIDYLVARRKIAHNIDDEKHPIKTFVLRQIAWFVFCRKNKYPKFVFTYPRLFAH